MSSHVEAISITPNLRGSTMLSFTQQPRSIENGFSASASPARTRTRNARRRTRFRPLGEGLETRRLLSTFKVNTTLDTVAVNLTTGKDASGHISLRSAIQAANSKPNADKIIIPSGTFTLTIAGANEDNSATGDLDIKGNVTITGNGSSSTIIDGNSLDRVFQVESGKVSISKLTIQHGLVSGSGGGLLNSGGNVTLSSVVIENNVANGATGATGDDGVDGATSGASIGGAGSGGGDGSDANGGGISNAAGSLSISNSVIATNQANGGTGGGGGNGGSSQGADGINGVGASAVGGTGGNGGNGGNGAGGGVFNAAGAT